MKHILPLRMLRLANPTRETADERTSKDAMLDELISKQRRVDVLTG